MNKQDMDHSDDGFEELMSEIKERKEKLTNQLCGGNDEIRRPKKPLTVFLRYHLEKFYQVKMRYQDWIPNKVTQYIKHQWDNMSEAAKEKYLQSYEQDKQKYEKLIHLYNKLTQKPKKPITPYFQFFSDNIQVYKKNYPYLSHNEITKMVGKDWNNFDAKKKIEMASDFSKQKNLYEKQIQIFQQKDNDYVQYDDYIQKVEDYEKEIEEELQNIRDKFPKPPTSLEKKKKLQLEKKFQDEEEKKEVEEENKISLDDIKKEELSDEDQQEKETAVIKKGNNKVEKSKKDVKQNKLKEKADNKIDKALKEVNDMSRRIKQKTEKISRKESKSTEKPKEKAKQPQEKSKQQQEKSQQPQKKAKSKTRSTRSQSQREGTVKRMARSRSQLTNKTEKQQEKAKSSSKPQKVQKVQSKLQEEPQKKQKIEGSRSSTRLQELITKEQKVVKNKQDNKEATKNIKVLKRKAIPDDIEEVTVSNKPKTSNTFITHILGMKERGGQTQYLVQLKNSQQLWIEAKDQIFQQQFNNQKLQIFNQMIKKQN